MLIDYFHQHFMTAEGFAVAAGWRPAQLSRAIEARIMPGPSYRLQAMLRVSSFVADAEQPLDQGYFLTSYLEWSRRLDQMALQTEQAAQAYFMQRYMASKQAFAASDRGAALLRLCPEVMVRFDAGHAAATWNHFLNGVYGVCTRDGAPETIFNKQVGVMIVEDLSRSAPDQIAPDIREQLAVAVEFLDQAASEFAPHERARSSRQRCVTDIRARYLNGV